MENREVPILHKASYPLARNTPKDKSFSFVGTSRQMKNSLSLCPLYLCGKHKDTLLSYGIRPKSPEKAASRTGFITRSTSPFSASMGVGMF